MNLIGNCCISNFMENMLGLGRTNPFAWADVDFGSVYNMVTGWDRIDWGSFNLKKVPHPYFKGESEFWLTVDGKVTIRYVHYLLDSRYAKPTKVGENVRHARIWEYIVDKYTERVRKMIATQERPAFILEWNHMDYDAAAWQRLAAVDTDLKIVGISRGVKLEGGRKNMLAINEPTIKWPAWYAVKHGEQIKAFLDIA